MERVDRKEMQIRNGKKNRQTQRRKLRGRKRQKQRQRQRDTQRGDSERDAPVYKNSTRPHNQILWVRGPHVPPEAQLKFQSGLVELPCLVKMTQWTVSVLEFARPPS